MTSLSETPRERKASRHAELPELVDVAFVAGWLKKPPKMIYRYATEGRLPGAVHIGRSIRFDKRKLQTWIETGGNSR